MALLKPPNQRKNPSTKEWMRTEGGRKDLLGMSNWLERGKKNKEQTKRIQTGKGRNVWRKQAVTLSFSIVLDSSHKKLNKYS